MFDRPKLLLFDIRRLIIALIYVPGLVDFELIVVHHLDLLRGGGGIEPGSEHALLEEECYSGMLAVWITLGLGCWKVSRELVLT